MAEQRFWEDDSGRFSFSNTQVQNLTRGDVVWLSRNNVVVVITVSPHAIVGTLVLCSDGVVRKFENLTDTVVTVDP